MRIEPDRPARRWLWFLGLWLAGVLVAGGISSLLRALIATLRSIAGP